MSRPRYVLPILDTKTGRACLMLLKHNHCFLSGQINRNREDDFLMEAHTMLVFKVN